MARLIFDLESDGLLEQLTQLHCMVIQDLDTDETLTFASGLGYEPIESGVRMLAEAEEIVGHNIIKFDIPAIQKLYPGFKPKGRVLDTLVLARQFWPEISDSDEQLVKKGKMKPKLRGRFSLEAFGVRLGEDKGDYSEIMKAKGLDPWAELNQDMVDYNVQDVVVNRKLYDYAMKVWRGEDPKGFNTPHSDKSVWMEMRVAEILARQERWGFAFNEKKAEKLYVALVAEREKLLSDVKAAFPPWWAKDGDITIPKAARSVQRKDLPPIGCDKKGNPVYPKEHYSPDAPYQKIKLTEFNPGSGMHIESRLKAKYGWVPQEYTPTGQAKTDESTLALLPYPEAKVLTAYMTVAKRIGQIAEGNQAWLKKVRNGRIHGTVVTVGAVTRRMTHNNPNIGQVPSVRALWGPECRELFEASRGFVLVGCDADALELRCLAGYMAAYDGGDYIQTVLAGDKSLGTDMHSVNCRALGMDPKTLYAVDGQMLPGREIAKTWFYAFIYGAGDYKLGAILGAPEAKRAAIGKKSKADFLVGLPALGRLVKAVGDRSFGVKDRKTKLWVKPPRGFIVGLDGGKIRVRHRHAAINTLLQSAGAIIMKAALVILDDELQLRGLVPGRDYEFCANVHDEWQIDVLPEHVNVVKEVAEWSIKQAGVDLNFKCPLAGNADHGANWKDTH